MKLCEYVKHNYFGRLKVEVTSLLHELILDISMVDAGNRFGDDSFEPREM